MEINRFGYYWLDTWILANVIQLATQDFCALPELFQRSGRTAV